MQFGFLGIDYKNADLTIRDEISFTDQKKLEFFHKAEEIGVEQVMILSTCNRSEIYYFFDDEQQIKKIQNIYCDMFDKAVLSEYIRKNPCIGVEMPKEVKKERRVLTKEEQEKFFTFASSYIHINVLGFFKNHGI